MARRAVSIFQTGFSHPVDPEFRIFLAKDNLHKDLSIEPLFAFLGGLQPSKRGSKDFEISEILEILFYVVV